MTMLDGRRDEERAPVAERPIVVVEPDDVARSALARPLGDVDEVADLAGLRDVLTGPSVVLFGPGLADADGMASVGPFLAATPSVGAILIAETLTTELLQSALRAGFRDVVAQPIEQGQLVDAIGRVASSLPGPTLPVPATPAEEPDKARMVTVFSTKGGAGKTMLATNVAVALAERTGQRVAIVDADLQFGDVSVMLKLAPRHTIVDAVNNLSRLDHALLDELLVTHEPSKVKVLPAPLEPAIAEQITAPDVLAIVGMLREMVDWVIVDTPAYFNDVVLGLIEESDRVLLLAGMDIPNIKNVRIGLQTLRLLDTPMAKISLVLNRSNSKVKLDVSEVERTLQVEAESRIPSDVAVPQSVNKGVPIVLDAPRSGPAKAIDALVTRLVEERVR